MSRDEPGQPHAVLRDLALRIGVSDGHILFDGASVGQYPRTGAEHAAIANALSAVLYERWFTRSVRRDAGDRDQRSTGEGRNEVLPENLVSRLRRAHAAAMRFESGWVVHTAQSDGGVLATRSGELIALPVRAYRNLTREGPASAGDSLAVAVRRDAIDASGAWWVTWSAGPAPRDPHRVRLYWHCPPAFAERLVGSLTALLESERVPYRLKCPVNASLFNRADAVVLYLALPSWTRAKSQLRVLHAELAGGLAEGVPPLTHGLGRGVAVAENPVGELSFGQSRSRAVANGLLLAIEAGMHGAEDLVAAIRAELPRRDISAGHPYLRLRTGTSPAVWCW